MSIVFSAAVTPNAVAIFVAVAAVVAEISCGEQERLLIQKNLQHVIPATSPLAQSGFSLPRIKNTSKMMVILR